MKTPWKRITKSNPYIRPCAKLYADSQRLFVIFPTREQARKRKLEAAGFDGICRARPCDGKISLELRLARPEGEERLTLRSPKKNSVHCVLYNRLPRPGYLQMRRDKRAKMRSGQNRPYHVKSRSENAPMLGWFHIEECACRDKVYVALRVVMSFLLNKVDF